MDRDWFVDPSKDRRMERWMDGWMDEEMDREHVDGVICDGGQTQGWKDGWMNGKWASFLTDI